MISIERIQDRLDAVGLNPFSAAKAAGLGADYVRDILRGKVKVPSGYRLARLATVLECSIEYLLGETSELGPPPQSSKDEYQPRVSHLPIQHRLARNVFRPPEDENETVPGWSALVFDLDDFSGRKQWLALIEDEHAQPVLSKNTIVHVLDANSDKFKLEARDILVVERYRDSFSLVERTLWRALDTLTYGSVLATPISTSGEAGAGQLETISTLAEHPTLRVAGRVLTAFHHFDRRFRLSDPSRSFGAWPE